MRSVRWKYSECKRIIVVCKWMWNFDFPFQELCVYGESWMWAQSAKHKLSYKKFRIQSVTVSWCCDANQRSEMYGTYFQVWQIGVYGSAKWGIGQSGHTKICSNYSETWLHGKSVPCMCIERKEVIKLSIRNIFVGQIQGIQNTKSGRNGGSSISDSIGKLESNARTI